MSKHAAPLLILTLLIPLLMTPIKPVSAITPGSWTTKAPMQVARAGLGVAVINGKIYAIGGSTQIFGGIPGMSSGITGNSVGTNEQYDPETNTWTFKTPMPTPRAEFAIAVFQNKIYCIGGTTNNEFTGVNEVYDPATDTWTTRTPMPAHSRGQANIGNGKIYVLSGNTYGTTNEVYDIVTDSWTEKTAEPYATFRWASVALDGKIYVLGGFDPLASGAQTNAIYDPNRDTWSAGAFPPLTIYGGAAAATVGVSAPKRIHIMGLGFGETLYPNYMYDPEQNTWVAFASMPDGRTNFGIAVVDDGLYVIGGDSNALYEKSADTGDWTPSAVNAQYIPIGYGTPDPSYVLEHNPPKISLLSPINQTYNESSVSLVFTVDKTVNWTIYSFDGQQNVTVTGNSTLTNGAVTNVTISNMTNGLHHITVFANDTFGNMGTSDIVSFTIAKAEPFPTVPVLVAIVVAGVVVAGAGFLLYRKRGRGRTQ